MDLHYEDSKLNLPMPEYCKRGKYSGMFNIAEIAGRQNALYLKPAILECRVPYLPDSFCFISISCVSTKLCCIKVTRRMSHWKTKHSPELH